MLPTRRFKNENWLPNIFDDFFDSSWMERTNATAPAINVIEKSDSYELEIAAPGMTKEDFNVRLNENGDIVINMEKKHKEEEKDKKDGHYLRREFSYSKFQQTMLLPDNAERDKITAEMNNGVLLVLIPKKIEDKVQCAGKEITIK